VEPVPVTAVEPVADVHLGEGIGQATGALELIEDSAIGEAILEHDVDKVPGRLGEAGDFAVAWVTMPAERGVDGLG